MVLDFPGGVHPNSRTQYGKHKIKNIDNCSVICLPATQDATLCIPAETAVKRGSLLGKNGEDHVYSSVCGVFRGIVSIEGKRYFVVLANKEKDIERIYEPETRALSSLSFEDITESAKKYAIIDSRSGTPLWKLLMQAKDNCRRVVIDCTEPDAASAINYRLCIEKAKSIVGGAKVLLQATGALKCVFAAEYYRNSAFDALAEHASDEKLFALARLEDKYPYGDRAIMQALYVKNLENHKTAIDEGVLIVSPEAAISLYESMVSGIPQLDRYISVCFASAEKGGNFCVPRGITLHDISVYCGGIEKNHFFVENSLLSGKTIGGSVSDGTVAVISASKQKRKTMPCISCGRCVSACPVRLVPADAILESGRSALKRDCIACGACDFICPSGIPLLSLIQSGDKSEEV